MSALAVLASALALKAWPASLPTALGTLALLAGAGWFLNAPLARNTLARFRSDRAGRLAAGALVQPAAPSADICLSPNLDAALLLRGFRIHFLAVQSAWDIGDLAALGELTLPETLDELLRQKHACRGCDEAGAGASEVVTLEADLVGFEVVPQARIASVQFSGLMRHACDAPGTPFSELWLLTQTGAACGVGGWRLARHQVLL